MKRNCPNICPKGWCALAAALMVLLAGCGKFDRSKIRMPKFTFITSENLHSIARADAGNVWVSGSYGTIIHSTDSGRTWQPQQSGVGDLLLGSIAFVNSREGWAAGVKGTVIHTTDGGATWQPQRSTTENDILDLFFLNANRGWAVGEMGMLIRTIDGGRTWASPVEEQDTIYNDVFFADNQTGWIVGEFGSILHTADGGVTWQPQQCAELAHAAAGDADWERPLPALYGIFFLDARRGWIVGMDGVIIATEDGGLTWKRLQSGTDKPLYSVQIRGSRGWIVGNKGIYLLSADGGQTWQAQNEALKTKFWLRDAAFGDDQQGLIVGARGTIARSTDGGASWEMLSGFRYDMEEFGLADF
jgi:photosystem II stability/assembly factor-like uncharacterized protein